MSDFKNAIDSKVVGLGNHLTKGQEFEYKYLDTVIDNLETMRDCGAYNRYIYALPQEFVIKFLKDKRMVNSQNRELVINKVSYSSHFNDYLLVVSFVTNIKDRKPWRMWLSTVFIDCRFIDVPHHILNKYFKQVLPSNVNSLLADLRHKKDVYSDWYEQNMKRAGSAISKELRKHPAEIVVSREAVRKSIRDIQRDSTEIANAWNATLTKEEQNILLKWLSGKIYSMRLYVLQGSSWDKAIAELYPAERYGSPRRTVPSEVSKDGINGYISVNSEDDVPYDILKKILIRKMPKI